MTNIYVDQISPRIQYAFDFIFGSRGLTYKLTQDQSEKVDLIYSGQKEAEGIRQADFMQHDRIDDLEVKVDSFYGQECFSFDGVPDPVASIFYVLSRYEEYNCNQADEYGRFPLKASKLSRDWLMKAMCDRWAEAVLNVVGVPLNKEYNVRIIPSFDIDNTYAYKLKTGKRKLLSVLRDMLRFDFNRMKERREVLSGRKKDPYDTFQKIREVRKQFPDTKVFWLIGKWGKKDRNISIKNNTHRELISSLSSEGIDIGLHPSFGSFQQRGVIEEERNELRSVCGKPVSISRQHYLRFQVASTFSDLEAIGFTDEYSMGFAEHVGFRSGTVRPHCWFDLSTNRVTNLVIHPFIYMDGTLREYMHLSIEQSKAVIEDLYREVKRYGGDFVFIWHNETIGDYGNWKGWSEVLDFTLSLGHE